MEESAIASKEVATAPNGSRLEELGTLIDGVARARHYMTKYPELVCLAGGGGVDIEKPMRGGATATPQ